MVNNPLGARVFISASVEMQDEARFIARSLANARHKVVSTWHGKQSNSKAKFNQTEEFLNLTEAQWLVLINPWNCQTSEASLIEFGAALAMGKNIVVLGRKMEAYQQPNIWRFDSWEECRDKLFPAPKSVEVAKYKRLSKIVAKSGSKKYILARWRKKQAQQKEEFKELHHRLHGEINRWKAGDGDGKVQKETSGN